MIKPGDLVQIWDFRFEDPRVPRATRLQWHGVVGYLVSFGMTDDICKVICFGPDSNVGKVVHVNRSWIRKLEKATDIKTPSPRPT